MPDDPDLRRRIEALQDDSELRKLAASARPRAPAADVDQDGAGKAELRDRLRRMAEAATAGPEREAEDAARERMAGDTQHPAAAQRKRRRKAATAKPDPGALLTDLQNARTAGEVLGAAARLCWAEAHDGAECPGHRIPAPADLADWVPMASPAVLAECAMLNAEAVTAAAGEVLSWPPALTDSLDSRQGARAAYALAAAWLFGSAEPGAAGVAWLLPRVHAAWLTIPAAVRTRQPAAPLVAGWQAAPVIVKGGPPRARHPAGDPPRPEARSSGSAAWSGSHHAARPRSGSRTRLPAGDGAGPLDSAAGALADPVRPDRRRPGADPRPRRAPRATAARRGPDRRATR